MSSQNTLTQIETTWTSSPSLSGYAHYALQAPKGTALPYSIITVVTNPVESVVSGDRDLPLVQVSTFAASSTTAATIAAAIRANLTPALTGWRITSERPLLDDEQVYYWVQEFRAVDPS